MSICPPKSSLRVLKLVLGVLVEIFYVVQRVAPKPFCPHRQLPILLLPRPLDILLQLPLNILLLFLLGISFLKECTENRELGQVALELVGHSYAAAAAAAAAGGAAAGAGAAAALHHLEHGRHVVNGRRRDVPG